MGKKARKYIINTFSEKAILNDFYSKVKENIG